MVRAGAVPGLQLAGGRGVECGHCAACAAQEQGQNQVRIVQCGIWYDMVHINIFKFKSLLHNNNIGSGLISFVAVQRSSHSSAEIAKHYTITRIHEG